MTTHDPSGGGRPLEATDLLDLVAVWGAQISPDGERIAYVVRSADQDRDVHRLEIRLAVRDASTCLWSSRMLTGGEHADSDPRWSPDGRRLAFVSNRSGSSQVHLLHPDGGEPVQLTSLPGGAFEPAWSPDGTRLVVVSTDATAEPDPMSQLVRRVRRLPYRTAGGGWITDRYSHLWIVDVATGAVRQLTRGPWSDGGAAWSPDGRRVAFVSLRHRTTVVPLSKNAVYVLDVGDPAAVGNADDDGAVAVSAGLEGVAAPAWMPDGSRIVCTAIATTDGTWLASSRGIYACDAAGAAPAVRLEPPGRPAVCLTLSSDPAISPAMAPRPSPDGRRVWYGAVEAGRLGVYAVDLATGRAELVIGGERAISRVSLGNGGRRLAYVANDWTHPGELYVADADGGGEVRVTALNDGFVASVATALPELLQVPASDGRFVLDTWLFRPSGGPGGTTSPIVQLAHGGPDGTFGPTYLFLVQLLASRGFCVQLVHPRGGLSYGAAFDAALDGHYGEHDEADFLDALDDAIAAGGVDGARVGIHGHSYGGFLAAWLPGRSPRYRAAVASALMANYLTQSLTAYYGGTHRWSEDGRWPDPWADPAEWWRRSAIAYVPDVEAAMLLLAGDEDRITPPDEHDQLFAALLMHGKAAEMVRFVGADHGVATSGTPAVRAERMRVIVDWFERYLGDVPASLRAAAPTAPGRTDA